MAGILKIDGPGLRARRYAISADGAGLVNMPGALAFARICLAAGELRCAEVGGFAKVAIFVLGDQLEFRGRWQNWLAVFAQEARAGLV